MKTKRTIECSFLPERQRRAADEQAIDPIPASRLPRISRLLALALRFDQLVRNRTVPDHATLARLGHVSRARITQIINLLWLAPDIQEEILFLMPIQRGRDPIHLRQLQPLAATLDWKRQRRLWRTLAGQQGDRNEVA